MKEHAVTSIQTLSATTLRPFFVTDGNQKISRACGDCSCTGRNERKESPQKTLFERKGNCDWGSSPTKNWVFGATSENEA